MIETDANTEVKTVKRVLWAKHGECFRHNTSDVSLVVGCRV